jgi:ribosomal protein S27AE
MLKEDNMPRRKANPNQPTFAGMEEKLPPLEKQEPKKSTGRGALPCPNCDGEMTFRTSNRYQCEACGYSEIR